MIIIAVLLVLGLWLVSMYNSLVRNREMIKNSRGQIAAQIESRWDLLSSLIDATKKYSEHESKTLEGVTRARTSVRGDSDLSSFEKDQTLFNNTVDRLNIVAESYPDLKASSIYSSTMSEISASEDNVRHARMIYTDTVTKYNRNLLTFPTSLFASLFGFKEEEYFASSVEKSQMPSWN